MRRALLLAALSLPLALRPASASQVEGAPGMERPTPAITPTVPIVPVLSVSPSLAPVELPEGMLPVAPLDPSLAPTVPNAAFEAARPASAAHAASAAAAASLSASKAASAPKSAAATAKTPTVTAKGALENAAPLARELLSPAGERSAEVDSQAASAIFGEAKRPEGAAGEVPGSENPYFSRLVSPRPTAPSSVQPPKPAKAKGTLTKKLIWANIIVFLLTFPVMPVSAALLGVIPRHIQYVLAVGSPIGIAHGLFTTFSYMFVHANLNHIIGNMFVFWLFGRDVEKRFGRRGMWRIYLASGLAAGVAAILLPSSMPIIGASAAVFGVVTAWLAVARKEGIAAPDERETRMLGILSIFSVISGVMSLFSPSWTGLLLGVMGGAVGFAIVRWTMGRHPRPAEAKVLFASWMVVQNVLMFLLGGPFFHGIYVLGHLVGGAVGAALAYRLFLKNSTSRVA